MRTMIALIALLVLTGCHVVIVPVPVAVENGLTVPDLAPAPADSFETAYAEVQRTYDAIAAAMQSPGFDASFEDADFRAQVVTLAQEWRAASNGVRYMPQPDGEQWATAWPRIVDAMDEFAYVASLIESAARENNRFIMLPGMGRLDMANALLTEAMTILGK